MKLLERNPKRIAEVNFKVNGVFMTEHALPQLNPSLPNTFAALVEADIGAPLDIDCRFGGPSRAVQFDLVIDGLWRHSRVCTTSRENQYVYCRFQDAFFFNEGGIGELGAWTLDRIPKNCKTKPSSDGTLGTVEIVISVAAHRNDVGSLPTYKSDLVPFTARPLPHLNKFCGPSPDMVFLTRPAHHRTLKKNQEDVVMRIEDGLTVGSCPWARVKFLYRNRGKYGYHVC